MTGKRATLPSSTTTLCLDEARGLSVGLRDRDLVRAERVEEAVEPKQSGTEGCKGVVVDEPRTHSEHLSSSADLEESAGPVGAPDRKRSTQPASAYALSKFLDKEDEDQAANSGKTDSVAPLSDHEEVHTGREDPVGEGPEEAAAHPPTLRDEGPEPR